MRGKTILRRHPIIIYFGMTFLISWGGALLVAAPTLLRGQHPSQMIGLLQFPVMLLGPSIAGISLTGIIGGKSGLRELFSRMVRWQVGLGWYATVLIPPALILLGLFCLRSLVSPVFTPHLYPLGIVYGLVPGYLEEIGWSGYVFPRLRGRLDALPASLLLGVLWGCWHLPVIDYLGAAYPHGTHLLPFALVFIAAMVAMRVIIGWVYCNTGSVLLSQLIHFCSTASLVVLSPVPILPAQEVLWYAVYAGLLWAGVAVILVTFGTGLVRKSGKLAAVPATTGS